VRPISVTESARIVRWAACGAGCRRRTGGTALATPSITLTAMNVDALFAAIGRFSVRFRWPMLLVWVAGAVAAAALLPSLSSVTQNDNTKFLPASAPVEHALKLAAPFGINGQVGTTVIAARTGARLTHADLTALTGLRHRMRRLPTVTKVTDLSLSSDGQAAQFVVFSIPPGPNQSAATTLVDGMQAKTSSVARQTGLAMHLTGPLPIQVDQQNANGSQGNKLQRLTALLIIVLLVLIFRSLSLGVVKLFPAVV
jgi:RND superfamily putative drug exporter